MRIVSLLPGATEALFALGVGESVVAVSHECDHPAAARHLPRVTRSRLQLEGLDGGAINDRLAAAVANGDPLYELDVEAVRKLRPDLVVAQDVCDVCAFPGSAIEGLLPEVRVLRQHPHTLEDVLSGIEELARATGGDPQLVPRLRRRLRAAPSLQVRAVFLEWLDPPYPAGHWTPDLLRLAGVDDPLARPGLPSRAVTWDAVAEARPELLLVAPCGLRRRRAEQEAERMRRAIQSTGARRVVVFDGCAYFNRPGPRLVESLRLLRRAVAV
jgi:iron complex transport system substrate-binding protein